MSTTTIRLPADMKERVAIAAERAGKTSHALIIDAIAQQLDEEERRNEFYNTAEKRYREIIATGETIPWKKMRAYMEDRLTDKTVNRPSSRKIST